MKYQEMIIREIISERKRQDKLWGIQNHDPMVWLSIIGEEYGEACQAANDAFFSKKEDKIGDDKWSKYRIELIETAACALAAIECLDRTLEPLILHTSEYWFKKICNDKIKILDPDGWDRKNFEKSWNEKISKHEFLIRLGKSTVGPK